MFSVTAYGIVMEIKLTRYGAIGPTFKDDGLVDGYRILVGAGGARAGHLPCPASPLRPVLTHLVIPIDLASGVADRHYVLLGPTFEALLGPTLEAFHATLSVTTLGSVVTSINHFLVTAARLAYGLFPAPKEVVTTVTVFWSILWT